MESNERNHSNRRKTRLLYVGLILVVALVLSSWYASSYYLQLLYGKSPNKTPDNSEKIPVNVLFNYGNRTLNWDNTTVRSNLNFYNITVILTNNRVESDYYPGLNEHLVKSINGLAWSGSYYWQLWIYCSEKKAWLYSDWGADLLTPTGSDSITVKSQTSPLNIRSNAFAWSYSDRIVPPVPGSQQTDVCS